jgi:hypothetical protein
MVALFSLSKIVSPVICPVAPALSTFSLLARSYRLPPDELVEEAADVVGVILVGVEE